MDRGIDDNESETPCMLEVTGRIYWNDPKVQQLAQQQRGERDKDKRRTLIGEILKLSKENVPYAPLYDEMHAYGIQDRVASTTKDEGEEY